MKVRSLVIEVAERMIYFETEDLDLTVNVPFGSIYSTPPLLAGADANFTFKELGFKLPIFKFIVN